MVALGVLTVLSCSDDDSNENLNIKKELISIIKDSYVGNSKTFSTKYNFYHKRLISIQYSDGSYDDILYENDLIKRILEFDSNNNLEWTTTYSYDNEGRLKIKNVIPSPNYHINTSRQKEFTYNGDEIIGLLTFSNGNNTVKTIMTINANEQIIKEILITGEGSLISTREYIYSVNDVSTALLKDRNDETSFEASYEYIDNEVSEVYHYNKYLFGDKWKNNLALSTQLGLNHLGAHIISEKYIKKYHTTILSSSTRDGVFEYEFDNNNNILKIVENINDSNGSRFKMETIFEYNQ